MVAFKRKQIDIYRSQTCFFQFSQSFTAFRHERFCQSPRTLIIEYFDVTSSRPYRQSETTETLIFTSDGGFTFFFSFSLAFIICFWQNSCSKASYFTLMWSCMSKISFQTFSWAALNRYAWFILHGFLTVITYDTCLSEIMNIYIFKIYIFVKSYWLYFAIVHTYMI